MSSVRDPENGFSLVEILVALFIMALASAVIVMAIPAGRDPLESEADRFETTLRRTLDRAISRGQAQGIRVEETSYSVYARIGGRWVPAGGDVQALPGGMTIGLAARPDDAGDIRPQIVVDASGIVSGEPVRIARGNRFREIDLMTALGLRTDE